MSRDESGGYPLTAQMVSGIQAARARSRLSCGTCEGATRYSPSRTGDGVGGREGELQAAESVRSRVPTRVALADSPVVAVIRPRIAVGWGAKGRGRPGERM